MTAGWLETYRGTVVPWEVDIVGHLTVAYYFSRFEDASLALLDAVGLGPAYVRGAGQGCVTVDGYVRYLQELRAGDLLHIESGVIDVTADGVVLGHRVVNSETGTVCATVEQGTRHVELDGWKPVPLAAAARQAAEARRVTWDGPPRERRPQPRGLAGFTDAARDTVKPWEIDVYGGSALSFFIHRFSASNIHTTTAVGMTPSYLRQARRGFSTFEFQLAFLAPLRAGDLVVVKSALVHVGTSSMRVFHTMLDARSGERVATLDQFGVHLDTETRRPTPLPDAFRARAQAILVPTDPA